MNTHHDTIISPEPYGMQVSNSGTFSVYIIWYMSVLCNDIVQSLPENIFTYSRYLTGGEMSKKNKFVFIVENIFLTRENNHMRNIL